MTHPQDHKEKIISECIRAGACAAGSALLHPLDGSEYARWLADGRQAAMAYLEKYTDIRNNPSELLPGAKSIICCAFSYRGHERHPLFADYSVGEDYHEVLRRRLAPVCSLIETLFPGASTRICADTAPLYERFWALEAGIGFVGRNSMLIVPSGNAGSRVFLAEIITTASIIPDSPSIVAGDPCEGCDRCLRACPGGAIDSGGVDARRCYSYNTIENRAEELPESVDLRGRRIYGCDICQDVCPYNSGEYTGPVVEEFSLRPSLRLICKPSEIEAMNHDRYCKLFRGSAIRRAKLEMLQRNARRALHSDYQS